LGAGEYRHADYDRKTSIVLMATPKRRTGSNYASFPSSPSRTVNTQRSARTLHSTANARRRIANVDWNRTHHPSGTDSSVPKTSDCPDLIPCVRWRGKSGRKSGPTRGVCRTAWNRSLPGILIPNPRASRVRGAQSEPPSTLIAEPWSPVTRADQREESCWVYGVNWHDVGVTGCWRIHSSLVRATQACQFQLEKI
jgi:hypothetical protein